MLISVDICPDEAPRLACDAADPFAAESRVWTPVAKPAGGTAGFRPGDVGVLMPPPTVPARVEVGRMFESTFAAKPDCA